MVLPDFEVMEFIEKDDKKLQEVTPIASTTKSSSLIICWGKIFPPGSNH